MGTAPNAKTIEGSFDERISRLDTTMSAPGYHDVMRIPVGATAIRIEEARPSSNNLAMKNSSDHYFLNGNSMIQVERDVELNGVHFEYDDGKPEKITAKGPLEEEVVVSVLIRKGNRDVSVKYEFSVPIVDEVDYMYKPGEWSACSVTCGKGQQTRTPYCIETKTQARVDDQLCDDANSTKPEFEKPCETVDCEAEWFEGEWEPCSQTCGDKGEQYRVVYCHQIFANGRRITVEDGNCTSERPAVRQVCNRFACPEWQAGPWSACSEKCGDAFQYRSVTCRSEKGRRRQTAAADCSKCNDTEETREVTCKDTQGRAYPLEKCLTDDEKEIPPDTSFSISIATNIKITTSFSACFDSEFGCCPDNSTFATGDFNQGCSNCSLSEFGCCADNYTEATGKGGRGCEEFVESPLNLEEAGEGSGEEKSGECQVKSENGETATVDCAAANATTTDFDGLFGSCNETEYGCCHDGVTLARGPNLEGCGEPTCAGSLYGCCKDRKTIAFGPHYAGCERSSFPCELSEHGCCADGETAALGANGTGCGENCTAAAQMVRVLQKDTIMKDVDAYMRSMDVVLMEKPLRRELDFTDVLTAVHRVNLVAVLMVRRLLEGPIRKAARVNTLDMDAARTEKQQLSDQEMMAAMTVDMLRRCYLPKVEGPLRCDQPQAKYWYDYNTKQCAAFWWRGCHGNANNFASWEECSTFCKDVGPFATTAAPAPQPPQPPQMPQVESAEVVAHPIIDERPTPGQRYDDRPRQPMRDLHELVKEPARRLFMVAVGGNLNRFRTEEECMQRCGFLNPTASPAHQGREDPSHRAQPQQPESDSPQQPTYPDQRQQGPVRPPPPVVPQQPGYGSPPHSVKSRQSCHLPLDVGKCQGSFDSWYYEMATGSCVEFKYSGCSGNANRFATREECESTCVRQPESHPGIFC
ncbi:Kunitz/Bovine pancreatic trypsin inhibitor domain protein, partial [Ostertagia ostertagi]